jgi:AcrR family transcriptional regulator
MVQTPWGHSETLRNRQLRPGTGMPRKAVRANQRERLFGAMVAAVATKGYEATRVEDLVELSGVSRKAFYEHFADKQDCFFSTAQSLVDAGVGLVHHHYRGEGPWEERVRRALEAFVALLAAQPAAARLCFVEIHAAGSEAIDPVERAFAEFAALVSQGLDGLADYRGMPPEISRAIVGGLRKVLHTRLYRGEEAELTALGPQLWGWGTAYRPPPKPLRRGRYGRVARRSRRPLADYDQPERLIRATAEVVAEKGYPATTVGAIVERGSTSLTTFYSYFADKEEAVLAALDSGAALLLAAVLPAFRRSPEWPLAIRGAFGAMFAYAQEEPAFARLGALEVYAAGGRALAQRDQVMEGLQALLAPGYELAPTTSPIAAEAIGGAIYALTYDQIRAAGPESLPEIAPLATYIALAPFLGPEQACEVANGDGRRLKKP